MIGQSWPVDLTQSSIAHLVVILNGTMKNEIERNVGIMPASKTPWQSCDGHRPDAGLNFNNTKAPQRDRLNEAEKKSGSFLSRLLKGQLSKTK